jgi:hypothetical protein
MGLLTSDGRKTLYGILALAAGLIVWDVVLLHDGLEDTTISAVLRITSRLLGFPYVFGVLAGHIFWHKDGPRDNSTLKQRLIVVALLGILLTGLALTCPSLAPIDYLCNHPHVVFALGFPVGHFMWPQYRDEVGS